VSQEYQRGWEHAAYFTAVVLTAIAAATPQFPVFVAAAMCFGALGFIYWSVINA
jgi:hypothetical protein